MSDHSVWTLNARWEKTCFWHGDETTRNSVFFHFYDTLFLAIVGLVRVATLQTHSHLPLHGQLFDKKHNHALQIRLIQQILLSSRNRFGTQFTACFPAAPAY